MSDDSYTYLLYIYLFIVYSNIQANKESPIFLPISTHVCIIRTILSTITVEMHSVYTGELFAMLMLLE